jgi:hypothetical protein
MTPFQGSCVLPTMTLDENKSRLKQQTFSTDRLSISALPGLPELSIFRAHILTVLEPNPCNEPHLWKPQLWGLEQ